jgi:hypothetical protein
MIEDPPGLGKTLPAMIAIVQSKGKFGRYSIVVTPASCIEQCFREFEQFFAPVSSSIPTLQYWTLTKTRAQSGFSRCETQPPPQPR